MLLTVCKHSDVHSEEKTQQERQHAAGGKVCTISEAELADPATSRVWRMILTLPSDFSKIETGLKGKQEDRYFMFKLFKREGIVIAPLISLLLGIFSAVT